MPDMASTGEIAQVVAGRRRWLGLLYGSGNL